MDVLSNSFILGLDLFTNHNIMCSCLKYEPHRLHKMFPPVRILQQETAKRIWPQVWRHQQQQFD
jgi:hypothetical protein